MGNCCFQSELPQTSNIQDNKESEDVKKNLCFVLGIGFAGKSTFRKRAQMLANMLENKDVVDNMNSHDKSMYQLTTIATIIDSLHSLTTLATKHGLIKDDTTIKHIVNQGKAKLKENLHGKIVSHKKMGTFIDHISNYDLLSTADTDHNHDNPESIARCINHLIEPFVIPHKIEQCFENIRSHDDDSLYSNIVWYQGEGFLNNVENIFDNDTIESFVQFFQSKEFKLVLNNYDGRIPSGGGGMLIDLLLERNHFKNLVSKNENYVLNHIDCLCSRQRTSGIIEVKINHNNECYSIIDVGGGGDRRRMRQMSWLAKILVFVMDLSGIERCIWEDDVIDIIDSLERLHELVHQRRKMFEREISNFKWKQAERKVDEDKNRKNGSDMSDDEDIDNDRKKGSMSNRDSVQILVLLNKYKVFENYVTNNVNCNSINCRHIIDWTPDFGSIDYDDKKAKEMIVSKYQTSKEMKHFGNKIWLNCQEIIQLIRLKIQMIFEVYQRYDHHCHDHFEQNVLVCDLLHDCDTIEDDVNKIQPPLKRKDQSLMFCEKILKIWIDQEGMENVLTKDMINVILIYCKSGPLVQFAEIFARIKQLCECHDLIQDTRLKFRD